MIFTHHAPSEYRCLWPASSNELQKYLQFGNLEQEIMSMKEAEGHLLVWGFGHTHHSSDFIRGAAGVRVVSNQCGYIKFEVNGIRGSNRFEPNKIIDLEQTKQRIKKWHETGVDPFETQLNPPSVPNPNTNNSNKKQDEEEEEKLPKEQQNNSGWNSLLSWANSFF